MRWRWGGRRFAPRCCSAAIASAFTPLLLEGEVCARLSGDEFAVFLPNGGRDRALELAEGMRSAAASTTPSSPSCASASAKAWGSGR